jgi:urease accessory protein
VNGGVAVHVEGTTVVGLATTPPLAAKVLPGPVLVLVGSSAGLLAHDIVRVEIDLAPGARLTVRTTAATIAHPCLSGGSTSLEIDCRLGAGARLVWLPEPLIACAGCRHRGRTRITLAPGATATWLDALTLGRSGEDPGVLEQRLDVELEGRPLLREALSIGPAAVGWNGPAVLGGYRHLATLSTLGRRLDADRPGALQLAGPGTIIRFVAHRGHELAAQIAGALPLFLDRADPAGATTTTPAPPRFQEALHV